MTDTNKVQVNLQATKNDLLILALTGILGSVPKLISLIFSIALPIIIIYLRNIAEIGLLVMALSVVPLALHINLIFRVLPKNAEADYKGGSYYGRTPLFTAEKDMIHIEKSTGATSDITIDNLHSIWETPGYFYFSITKNNTIILPKRQLDSEQKKFVHSVRMSMPRKKRRNPENPTFGKLIVSGFVTLVTVFGLTISIMSLLGLFKR